MNPRLALLSAILANPEDDLPRLVFADWLEENGTTDADAARVEFIRLGCKGKAKSRISPAETKWLDANWKRLLGTTVAATHPRTRRMNAERDGRFLRLQFRWQDVERVGVALVCFEYVRGFARRVEYLQGHAYQRFWQAAASDEPLAYHRPELPPDLRFGPDPEGVHAVLFPTTWGEDAYARVTGIDFEHPSRPVKVFHELAVHPKALKRFHPLAVEDEPLISTAHHHLRAAVATAMTALAREHVGLQPVPVEPWS
jgi:uncharacterized protein (TIGR02996 family)